jgi:hypothetical protein
MNHTIPLVLTTSKKFKSRPNPDQTEMLRFLQLLHGNKPTWFLKFHKDRTVRPHEHGAQHFGTSSRFLNKMVEANTNGSNVAVAINQIGEFRRTNDNVTGINAVFIDVDNGVTTENELMDLPLPPNIIVATSPGRLHAYWLVSNCSVQKFKRIQRALAKRFDSDRNVCDPARMMRLPGSINWNHGRPVLAQIIDEFERPQPLESQSLTALSLTKSDASRKSV